MQGNFACTASRCSYGLGHLFFRCKFLYFRPPSARRPPLPARPPTARRRSLEPTLRPHGAHGTDVIELNAPIWNPWRIHLGLIGPNGTTSMANWSPAVLLLWSQALRKRQMKAQNEANTLDSVLMAVRKDWSAVDRCKAGVRKCHGPIGWPSLCPKVPQ